MDVSEAGKLAAEQMENLEKAYADIEGAEIGMMINIVQIIRSDGTLDNRVISNAPAPFMALGLMRVAEEVLLHGQQQSD